MKDYIDCLIESDSAPNISKSKTAHKKQDLRSLIHRTKGWMPSKDLGVKELNLINNGGN